MKMVTYYLETSDGVFRLNVPVEWEVKVLDNTSGRTTVTFGESGVAERLMFNHVLSLRDSATHLEELTVERDENGNFSDYSWSEVDRNEPLTSHGLEGTQIRATRRSRRNQTNNNGRVSPPGIPLYDDEQF